MKTCAQSIDDTVSQIFMWFPWEPKVMFSVTTQAPL